LKFKISIFLLNMYHSKTSIYEKVETLIFHIVMFLRTFQEENINSKEIYILRLMTRTGVLNKNCRAQFIDIRMITQECVAFFLSATCHQKLVCISAYFI
jgi:hypothetical protein